ncbi:hypothetical protein N0B31_10280 [Salinirubellus salinus]|uniref:Uncharacterized protein n=1 Tax=Salinirubellus salinus TaxID=1364945 RepID=A0A9E7R6W5_9EURY|nr:hypothetical protein [Salinirubellus salinus]UWM56662.1 hypothetical protein N0B31_10280 [Salinirubellus salinus]
MDDSIVKWIRGFVVEKGRLPSSVDYEHAHGDLLDDDILTGWDEYLVEAEVLDAERANGVDSSDLIFFIIDYVERENSTPTLNELLGALNGSEEQLDRVGEAFVHRYGSWFGSLDAAGITSKREPDVDGNEIVTDVRRVNRVVGGGTVSTPEYIEYGAYAVGTAESVLGVSSWGGVLDEAGLEQSTDYPGEGYSEQELISELWRVYELKRDYGMDDPVPKTADLKGPDRLTNAEVETFIRKFGSLAESLEAAGIPQDGE